jgi:membrane associated rhomboid family serine protease
MSVQTDVKRLLSPRSAGGQLALVFFLMTIAAGVSVQVGVNLVLRPEAVVHELKLWVLVTHLFVGELSPFSLLFGVLIALTNGNALEARWGTRRFWTFVFGVGLSSGAALVLLATVFTGISLVPSYGAWALLTWLWVAEGLLLGSRQVNFWGLPITGYIYAGIGLLFPVLTALRGGWYMEVETFIGLGLTAAFVYGQTPANWWLRFRSWQLGRELKKRASHLRSVDGGRRNTGGGSDKYMQ